MSKHSLCVNRLQKEYLAIERNKNPLFTARPLPSNILEWHFVIFGPKDSPYEGGTYHGQIIFPLEYPHKPPSILMTTPSGRFQSNVRICTSNTDYHSEQWSPSWSASTILMGLISFMTEESTGFASITKSKQIRQQYAAASMPFNLKNPIFVKMFPELVENYKKTGESSSSLSIVIDDDDTDNSSNNNNELDKDKNVNNNNNNNEKPKTTTTSTTTTSTTTTTTSTTTTNINNNLIKQTNNNKSNTTPVATIKKNNNNNNKNNSRDKNDTLSIIFLSVLLVILSILFYKYM